MVINLRETAASSIATAVKNSTAEENAHLGPEVSKMITKDFFMDEVNINAKYDKNIKIKKIKSWFNYQWITGKKKNQEAKGCIGNLCVCNVSQLQ